MKKFFSTIKESVYGPASYVRNKDASGGQTFGYFIKLCLTSSVIMAIAFSAYTMPGLISMLSQKSFDTYAQTFPADLHIYIKDGMASSTPSGLYTIPMPEGWASSTAKASSRQSASADEFAHRNLLTIDTGASSSVDAFAGYDTLALLTRDYFVYEKSSNGQITIQPVKNLPNITIDRASISGLANRVQPMLKIALPVSRRLRFLRSMIY